MWMQLTLLPCSSCAVHEQDANQMSPDGHEQAQIVRNEAVAAQEADADHAEASITDSKGPTRARAQQRQQHRDAMAAAARVNEL